MTEPFWNTFQKLAVLKNYFSQRSIWWTGVSIKLWLVVHSPQLYQKKQSSCQTFWSAENSNAFAGKPPWWRLHPYNLIKKYSTKKAFLYWFCKIALFIISRKIFYGISLPNIFEQRCRPRRTDNFAFNISLLKIFIYLH